MTPYTYHIRLIRVVDADTIHAEVDQGFHIYQRMFIRLYGVNAPERRGVHATPKGDVAFDFTKRWLFGRDDLVMTSNKYNEREKYGRSLATIWRGDDPVSLNDALVRAELAERTHG